MILAVPGKNFAESYLLNWWNQLILTYYTQVSGKSFGQKSGDIKVI